MGESAIAGSALEAGKMPSRSLQEAADEYSAEGILAWILPTALLWLLNAVIVALVLARILIFGEPVTQTSSKESDKYSTHSHQAEIDVNNGKLENEVIAHGHW